MAEAAPARTPAHDLHRDAVVDNVDIRDDELHRRGRQFGDDALGHDFWDIRDDRFDVRDCAIVKVIRLIQAWNVNPLYPRKFPQHALTFDRSAVRTFERLEHMDNVVNDFLALADHERVDEGVHGLGVHGGMSAGDDDRMGLVAVRGSHGDPG